MTEDTFRPVLYLKQGCPFCLKVRIAVLETGWADALDIRIFIPGTSEEEAIRSELKGKLENITFPVAQLDPGYYFAESDVIVTELIKRVGRTLPDLPVYDAFLQTAFQPLMRLNQENKAFKAAVRNHTHGDILP